ncbi:beclin-1-like protein isoform X2 [Hylaeus volcanicus]|uniref:beclin-1-like protein isoform X2 n=1 Tax=Hylaeus volcanicus TaxID=313075 RepID=UPI0023B84AAF|nr:beclin-1-like protein isoform X2 [Hylaeus volcanicus]
MISLICSQCGKRIHFNDIDLAEIIDDSGNKIIDNSSNHASKESFEELTKPGSLDQPSHFSQDICFGEEDCGKINSVEPEDNFVTDGVKESKTPSLQNLTRILSALLTLQTYVVQHSFSTLKTTQESSTVLPLEKLKNESNNVTNILQNLTSNNVLCFFCLFELKARLQRTIQTCQSECSMYSDYLTSALSPAKEPYDHLEKQLSISNVPFQNEKFSDKKNKFFPINFNDSQGETNSLKTALYKHKKKKMILSSAHMKYGLKYPPPCRSAFISSEQNTLDYNRTLLSILTRSNVLEDAFRIEVRGMYGIINGLRLGKVPEDSVTWNEVNAAWGQSAFLLDTVVQLILKVYMNYVRHSLKEKSVKPNSTGNGLSAVSREFVVDFPTLTYLKTHKIVPRGNRSIVLKRSDMSCFELYRTEGGLTQYFSTKRFNAAMVIFLEITREIITVACFVKKKIENDEETSTQPLKTINDLPPNNSIHLPCSSGGESWCQCLKELLLSCQWLLQLSKALHNSFMLPRE